MPFTRFRDARPAAEHPEDAFVIVLGTIVDEAVGGNVYARSTLFTPRCPASSLARRAYLACS
jgi:hypothetical protein